MANLTRLKCLSSRSKLSAMGRVYGKLFGLVAAGVGSARIRRSSGYDTSLNLIKFLLSIVKIFALEIRYRFGSNLMRVHKVEQSEH
ncbi:hypothetical protein [Nostoc sp.]|uniref:hypothetical protein n=1 Tax=Nostoc sp. TaxID=1180 RepID=UPI002FF844FE